MRPANPKTPDNIFRPSLRQPRLKVETTVPRFFINPTLPKELDLSLSQSFPSFDKFRAQHKHLLSLKQCLILFKQQVCSVIDDAIEHIDNDPANSNARREPRYPVSEITTRITGSDGACISTLKEILSQIETHLYVTDKRQFMAQLEERCEQTFGEDCVVIKGFSVLAPRVPRHVCFNIGTDYFRVCIGAASPHNHNFLS